MFDESLRLEIARLQNTGAKSGSGSAGDDRPPEIETHVDRLLSLLKNLNAINDRADDAKSRDGGSSNDFDLLVIAALREAECADLFEKSMEADLTALCRELEQKDEALKARETALARLEEASKEQLAELESRIQNQEKQVNNLVMEQQKLTAERDHLLKTLNEAQRTAKQAEAGARQFRERMEEEVAALRLEIEKREEVRDARKPDLHRAEGDQKKDIETLQLRLQDTEAKLASQEKELNEKERAIHAAGVRETELGRLIQRLSSECEKLSAELCEKNLALSRFGDKTRTSLVNGGNAWGKVIRLMRAGRTASDNNKRT